MLVLEGISITKLRLCRYKKIFYTKLEQFLVSSNFSEVCYTFYVNKI